jgi:hypothetical protein
MRTRLESAAGFESLFFPPAFVEGFLRRGTFLELFLADLRVPDVLSADLCRGALFTGTVPNGLSMLT